MIFGLDIHGVSNLNPKLFSEFSRLAIQEGHQVHIITGMMFSLAKNELKQYKILYTHFFSVTDHHIEIESGITFDKNRKPWLRDELWDKTKGNYAKLFNVDIHIDDSKIYGKYFPQQTQYIRYEHQIGFHVFEGLWLPTTIHAKDLLGSLINLHKKCQE